MENKFDLKNFLIENKFTANSRLIEADSALGANRVVGLSQTDKSLAQNAIGGGFKDQNKEDDVVAGKKTTIAVGKLKPAQNEIIKEMVFSIAIASLLKNNWQNADLGNIVSNDNYIMDGHHRWAAIALISPKASVQVTQIDLPGQPLVTTLNLFTKGKFGIDKGNPGKGSIAEFTGANFDKVISDAMANGIKGEFPVKSEDVIKALGLVPGAEGDAEKGKQIMMANADKLPKQKMPGAPARVEMPVIDADQVKTVQTMLAKGAIDIQPPFSKGVRPVNENILPIHNRKSLMENTFDLKKFLVENKLTYNSKLVNENRYASEEENKVPQIMSIVKEKIGFDYPIFEDIVEDAIALMDEQEGTGAIEALYAAAETWNEEFQESGDENGEDITSRMMSILDSMAV